MKSRHIFDRPMTIIGAVLGLLLLTQCASCGEILEAVEEFLRKWREENHMGDESFFNDVEILPEYDFIVVSLSSNQYFTF